MQSFSNRLKFGGPGKPRSSARRRQPDQQLASGPGRRLHLEALEDRRLLAFDFGDAPAPYPTTLAENGARHEAIGPTLGATRDSEPDGAHSATADGDGSDDDGVTFGPIRVGQLGAIATVNVQNAPAGAKLDAWIDFNADGSWGGPGEQIADTVSVVEGDNPIRFDVPSWAADGQSFARFRLSTAGNQGLRESAIDGELEDLTVTVSPPARGKGVFGGQNTISAAADGAHSVFAADLDGDGDVDVLSASRFDDKIIWYEQTGGREFTAHEISASADGANSVFAADVDGDGDQDVLSASKYDATIAWYENNGEQDFTEHTISIDADAASTVYVADIDGNGELDVLAASFRDDTIEWHENQGNHTFLTHTISTTADGVSAALAVDVDRDGDLDILSAPFLGAVTWYENLGNQTFSNRLVSTSSRGAAPIDVGDLDDDGDLDVISGSFLSDAIDWHENSGSGTFVTHAISVVPDPASLFVADLDGDGDGDVLSAERISDTVTWYENLGNRNFISHIISTSADGVYSVFAADMDGDGDLDVLSASPDDDKISWYENLLCGSCADTYSAHEDRALVVDSTSGVLANDGAQAGEVLTASVISATTHGVLTLAASGSFTYTPNANYFGADSFTYRITSDQRAPRDAIVTITVNPVPDPPVAGNDAYRISEGGALVVSNQATSNANYIPRNAIWKYLDNGSDQGTAWRERAFNDSAWAAGPAELGYGDGGEATVVDCGPAGGTECSPNNNPSNKYITTYFRRAFHVDDPARVSSLAINLRRDDGAVVYLNGVELFRDNLPTGTINYQTTAPQAIADDGANFAPFANLNRAPLVVGMNVIAVEIHQQSATSSDISFDLELTGVITNLAGLLANDTDADGDPLTAMLDQPPLQGNLLFNANGSFTYTPPPSYFGTVQFTYRAFDGTLFSDPATVTIIVDRINQPPMIRPDAYTLDEDTVLNVAAAQGVLANDTDPDGDPLAASPSRFDTPHSSLLLNADGSFVYTPRLNYYGADTFTYTGTDGAAIGTGAITITVRPVSDPPVAQHDAYDAVAGRTLVVAVAGVLGNDADPDGELLLATLESDVAHGTLSLNFNGSFMYTPATGFLGTDSFTYRAFDGTVESNVATVTIEVTAGPPTAQGDAYTTREDVPLVVEVAQGVLANDQLTIPGATLTAQVVAAPTHGTLSLLPNGSFKYVPAANYFGSDSFTYVATDGQQSSPPATVQLTITPVNDAPISRTDVYTTAPGVAVTDQSAPIVGSYRDLVLGDRPRGYWRLGESNGVVAADAVENLPATYVGSPQLGISGALVGNFDQAVDFDGIDDLVTAPYSSAINPGGDFTVEAWVLVDGGQNDYRSVITSRNSGAGIPAQGFSIYATNTNRWSLWTGTAALTGEERWDQLDGPAVSVGQWTHVVGTFDALSDAGGGLFFGTKQLFVNGVLVATSNNARYRRNDTGGLRIGAGATEQAPLFYFYGGIDEVAVYDRQLSAAEVLEHFQIAQQGGLQTLFARGATWNFRDDIPNGSAALYPVDAQNDRWDEEDYDDTTWRSGPALLGYGGITAAATATTLTFGGNAEDKFRTALFRRTFFVADARRVEALQFDFVADDGASFRINGQEILRHNLPGERGDGSLRTETLTLAIGNEDLYTSITVELSEFPRLLVVGVNTIAVEIHQSTPASSDLGFDLALSATLASLPVAPAGVLVNDADPEGDALTANRVDGPFHGTLDFHADGSFIYTPQAGFVGIDQFAYVANDGPATSLPTRVTINVGTSGQANVAPIAANDFYITVRDRPLVVAAAGGVLANDDDLNGDPLVAAMFDPPQHGTLTLAADGAFTYTPAAGYVGEDSFRYTLRDGSTIVESGDALIVVRAVVDPANGIPIAAADHFAAPVGGDLTRGAATGVLANDRDGEGTPLAAVLSSPPTHGTVDLSADGSFRYVALAGFHGADRFAYRVTDGNTFSQPVYVLIDVPLPGAPQSVVGSWRFGDANQDGAVDRRDLTFVMQHNFTRFGMASYMPFADLDANGQVDIRDLLFARDNLLDTAPPTAATTALVDQALADHSTTSSPATRRSLHTPRTAKTHRPTTQLPSPQQAPADNIRRVLYATRRVAKV